jgi:hypothetical protein
MNYISNEKECKNNYNTFDDVGAKPKPGREEKDALLSIENESNNKLNKIVRFAVDYCRASPNMTLNNKNMLNIGWRIQKFNYDVNYEIVDYKGDKSYVNCFKFSIIR